MLTFLSTLFAALPRRLALALGRGFGLVWYYCLPIRRRVAAANIARAIGDTTPPAEQKRILRACFMHLGMYAVESLRLPHLRLKDLPDLIEVHDFKHFREADARGKGVILIGAHIGSFDLFACNHAMRTGSLHVIMKKISWKPAQRFFLKIRKRSGIIPIASKRSKNDIYAALRAGHTVAFPCDQHMAKHRALVCTFFGQRAATSPAPARFAYDTGAPIIPAVMWRQPDGRHKMYYFPELKLESPHTDHQENLRHNTQRINDLFESWIRQVPEQWLWHHKRFKAHDNPEGWEYNAAPPEKRSA